MLAEVALPIVIFTAVFGPPLVARCIEVKNTISKKLLKRRFKKIIVKNTYNKIKTSDICVICQDDLDNGEKCYELYCNHIYHRQCILEWMTHKMRCPCCGPFLVIKGGYKMFDN